MLVMCMRNPKVVPHGGSKDKASSSLLPEDNFVSKILTCQRPQLPSSKGVHAYGSIHDEVSHMTV